MVPRMTTENIKKVVWPGRLTVVVVTHALGELGPHFGIREIRLLENVHQLIQVLKERKEQRSQGTGNTLLTDHQEVHEHEHREEPRHHEGVKAVKASQSRLTNAFSTTE